MIIDFIRQLGSWAWLFIGLALLAFELLLPGNVFVWFGLAALITGGLTLVTDYSWQIDLLVFGVLSLVLVYFGRRYFARSHPPSEQPFLNQRAAGLVGKTYPLAAPIVSGHGRIRIDDTTWRITGPDLPAGAQVRVVSVDGAVLGVTKAG